MNSGVIIRNAMGYFNMSGSLFAHSYRLGEVTLRDVKAAVDREGNYRYHFKALDPEFGTVKEEVSEDNNEQ